MKAPSTFRRRRTGAPRPIRCGARPASRRNADAARRSIRSNRYRREGREAYDDGWRATARRLRRAMRRRAPAQDDGHDPARAHDHRAQRVARHPVHPIDQSLPGLRARLHLLLRAADARLSRPVARPRFRDEALRQAGRAGAAARGARASQATSAIRSRSAPTPIRTSRSSANGRSRAGSSRCWPRHEHPFTIVTKSALVERDLDLIAPMAAKNMARVYISITTLDTRARTLARAARGDAAAPPAGSQGAGRRRRAGRRAGGARHSATQRPRPRGDPRGRGGTRRRWRWDGSCSACRWRSPALSRLARRALSAARGTRDERDSATARRPRLRRRASANGCAGPASFAELIESASRSPASASGLNRDRTPLDISRFRPPVPEGPRQLALL